MEDFSKPKLVYAELARTGNAFTIDMNNNMVGNTGYIITVPDNNEDTLSYLLAFLNSRVMLYCLDQITSRFDENGWRWLRQYVERLCVPVLIDKKRIITIVKKTSRENQKDMGEKINTIVANIYNLTKEEETYINKQLSKY